MLVLEEFEHAKARGAPILAEIVGYATNADGAHITEPQSETQAAVMRSALQQADLAADAIDFVSGHAAATDIGDVSESHATAEIFGNRIPFHSLKGHFGHTLGGCGGIEAWLAVEMMREDWFAPTANLVNVDPRCAELDYLTGEGRALTAEHLMTNNFAFGGINTSIILKRV